MEIVCPPLRTMQLPYPKILASHGFRIAQTRGRVCSEATHRDKVTAMQDQLVECEACETETEEFECPTCGMTGIEIADLNWHRALWAAIDLN